MSYVTDVLIQGAYDADLGRLNEWLKEADTDRHQQLARINTDKAGGNKCFTESVWAASLNYAPIGLLDKLCDPDTWETSYKVFWTYHCEQDDPHVGLYVYGQGVRVVPEIDLDVAPVSTGT